MESKKLIKEIKKLHCIKDMLKCDCGECNKDRIKFNKCVFEVEGETNG